MGSERDDDEQSPSTARRPPSARVLALRAELLYLRHELQALLESLDAASEVVSTSAVVTAVVPKTVLLHHPSTRRE
ncbi:MAG: hypothetical protein ABW252_01950 [Polyangiales bacterium]